MAKYRYEDEYDDYEPPKSSPFDNPGRHADVPAEEPVYEDVPERSSRRVERRAETPKRTRRPDPYYEADRKRAKRKDPYYEADRRMDSRPDPYYEEDRRRERKRRKHPFLRFILILLLILILLAAVIGVRYYGLSNYVRDDSTKTSSVDLPNNSGVYNILLVGLDRRDESWSGNSDSMILLSINSKKSKVFMISFMRDLYADIPGYGVNKLNAACAYGGLPLLCQTIEENYRVNIDNYAAVDFASMIKIVDLAGGVTIDVSAAEAEVANGYIYDMANTIGDSADAHYFPAEGGTINADGYQAVAFSRIRYVGNSDYERTERQRTVLSALIGKVQKMNPIELNSFMEQALPYVTHNIDSGAMTKLALRAPLIMLYPTVQDRVPYDGLYTVDGEILVPDMEATRQRLQETLY